MKHKKESKTGNENEDGSQASCAEKEKWRWTRYCGLWTTVEENPHDAGTKRTVQIEEDFYWTTIGCSEDINKLERGLRKRG
jgi:hypothetical protein